MVLTELQQKIVDMHHEHPEMYAREIAEACGTGLQYAQRILRRHGLSKPTGGMKGSKHPSWIDGKIIGLDGYVLHGRPPKREHRLVMAEMLGRPLTDTEVVDHIDGITIHNVPSNLQLFADQAEHLRATKTGVTQRKSASGLANTGTRTDLGGVIQRVDIHRQRRARGDVRLRAILRASLELGIDHPCLSGTQHWLVDIGIDPSCYRSLERAWADLCQRYEADLSQ